MSAGRTHDGVAAPRVTVLLPVYEGREHLPAAIESILGQSFRDFELLVIDDGSSDGSADVVAACHDPRVRCVRNDRNLGVAASLNRGLELARGEIVARMDADDTSLPERLRRQVEFLDANPEIGACGAWTVTTGRREGVRIEYPTRAEDVRCGLIFDPTLAHPTVCLRRAWFERSGLRYDEGYVHAEDYDLWCRASACFPLANLGEVLLRYRVHDASVSERYRAAQQASVARIHRQLLAEMGLSPTDDELVIHGGGRVGEPVPPLAETERWLQTLLEANRACGRYPEPAFGRLVGRRWLRAANGATGQGQSTWARFARSPLSRHVPLRARLRTTARAAARALRSAR
ncbi:MAG TPA: glycosyltransferase [Myxococcota bacterium]|nr:glycosyltransferase [Myxococcota bacterium]